MKKTTPTDFVRWLKEKDVYSRYVANIHDHPNFHKTQRNDVMKCLKKAVEHLPYSPLRSRYIGFDWEQSNEGMDFWSNLDNEFKKNF